MLPHALFTLTVRDTHSAPQGPWRIKGQLPCGTLLNIFVAPDDLADSTFQSRLPPETVWIDAEGDPVEPRMFRDILRDGYGLRLPCGAQGRLIIVAPEGPPGTADVSSRKHLYQQKRGAEGEGVKRGLMTVVEEGETVTKQTSREEGLHMRTSALSDPSVDANPMIERELFMEDEVKEWHDDPKKTALKKKTDVMETKLLKERAYVKEAMEKVGIRVGAVQLPPPPPVPMAKVPTDFHEVLRRRLQQR